MPPPSGPGGTAAVDVDLAGIRGAAGPMGPLATGIPDHGAMTVRTWREAAPFYVAPESGQFLAALDPLNRLTMLAGERVGRLGQALGTYADQAEPLITEIRRLQADSGGDAAATAERERRLAERMAELLAVEQACAAAITALTAPEVRPERVRVGEQVETVSAVLSVGWFSIGQSGTFKMTTFSDGTVHLTATNGGEVGGEFGAGPLVELGAGLTFEAGSTWRFRDVAEAERFRADLEAYIAQERAVLLEPGAALGVAVVGGIEPPRNPDLMVSTLGVPLSGTAAVPPVAGLNASVSGAGEVTLSSTVVRDLVTGATTTTTNREALGRLGVEVAPGAAVGGMDGTSMVGSSTGVVRNANGEITRVILTTTERHESSGTLGVRGAGGDAPGDPNAGRHRRTPDDLLTGRYADQTTEADVTVTTTSVEIRPEDRAVAERYVAGEAYDPYGGLGDASYRPDRAVPGDDFQNLAHRRGVVTEVDYRDVVRNRGVEAGVDLGPEVGIEGGVETTESEATGSRYLGPPDADGVRRFVPLPD